LRFFDPTGLISLADIGLSSATTRLSSKELNEIQIDKPNSSAPKSSLSMPTISLNASNNSVPFFDSAFNNFQISLFDPDITLSSLTINTMIMNPGVKIEVLNDNKILIDTSMRWPKNETVIIGNIEINGDVIIIDKMAFIGENGLTINRFDIFVRDNLHTAALDVNIQNYVRGTNNYGQVNFGKAWAPSLDNLTNSTILPL